MRPGNEGIGCDFELRPDRTMCALRTPKACENQWKGYQAKRVCEGSTGETHRGLLSGQRAAGNPLRDFTYRIEQRALSRNFD